MNAEETGWVLERADSSASEPAYWAAGQIDPQRSSAWTYNNKAAIRFARRQDAQAVADRLMKKAGVETRTCEHIWSSGGDWVYDRGYLKRPASPVGQIAEGELEPTEEMAERFSAGMAAYWQGRRSGRDGDAVMAGLRAALSAAPAPPATGWQDISTAPKDGQSIILFTRWVGDEIATDPFDEVQIGYWDVGNLTGDIWHREPGWSCEKIGSATHWMPLPSAPRAES